MLMHLFSNPLLLVISLVTVVIALSFHEWAHAFAAYKLGDPTAKNMGRLTLDPLRHIDIVGFLCMVLFRFGWAKPVPVNPNNFKHMRRDEIIVSLAGIVTNFLLAFATIFISLLINKFVPITNEVFWTFITYLSFINLSLMAFNLLPIPPLDGYQFAKNLLIKKVPLNFWWNYERYGFVALLVLIIFGSSFLGAIVSAINNGILNVCFMLLY